MDNLTSKTGLAEQIELARKAIEGWPNDVRFALGIEPRAPSEPRGLRQIGVKHKADRTEYIWWETPPEGTPIYVAAEPPTDALRTARLEWSLSCHCVCPACEMLHDRLQAICGDAPTKAGSNQPSSEQVGRNLPADETSGGTK